MKEKEKFALFSDGELNLLLTALRCLQADYQRFNAFLNVCFLRPSTWNIIDDQQAISVLICQLSHIIYKRNEAKANQNHSADDVPNL